MIIVTFIAHKHLNFITSVKYFILRMFTILVLVILSLLVKIDIVIIVIITLTIYRDSAINILLSVLSIYQYFAITHPYYTCKDVVLKA